MFDVGRVCVKIAGRDAGEKCVIVEVLDDTYVLVDGMTRRRKCNKLHLEPTSKTLDIKAKASHDDVAKAFKELGLEVKTTKPKAKTVKPKAKSNAKPKTENSKKEKNPKAEKPSKVEKVKAKVESKKEE
jgi:large subunit ribosomal protein L14e